MPLQSTVPAGPSLCSPPAANPPLECRHAIACIGRYVVVCGGLAHTAKGQALHRQDTAIYDTAAFAWEGEGRWRAWTSKQEGWLHTPSACLHANDCCSCTPAPHAVLDSTAFGAASSGPTASAVVMLADQGRRRSSSCSTASRGSMTVAAEASAAPFLGAGTCAFAGSQLLLLKPGSSGGSSVSELWTVDLTLPEQIDAQRQAKAAAAKVVQTLTLECEEVGAGSARLAWRAPAANADKASVVSCWRLGSREMPLAALDAASRACLKECCISLLASLPPACSSHAAHWLQADVHR